MVVSTLLHLLVAFNTLNAQLAEVVPAPSEQHGANYVQPSAPTYTATTSISRTLRNTHERIEDYYARKLATLPFALRPGTDHREDSSPTAESSRRCRSLVYRTLTQLPEEQVDALKELTLFYTTDGRRGLGGEGSILLRCLNVTDEELSSVLMHEMGHIVDAGLLTGDPSWGHSGFFDFDNEVALDDPSLSFYKVSWLNDRTRKISATSLDFVSLYGMTDPFEDFAETYNYFRLHGPEFRTLATTNAALKSKYEFMRDVVFKGTEFDLNKYISVSTSKRSYDTTVLPYSLRGFYRSSSR
ncbi:hypothetical protein CO046_00740 [Candidatus Peregrinibacteria bacterium CG_4_9_14_0_2_um_filter_53_11]|nr:MAG: hypothetical protein CO046_00740 [Candidatus Peregrinibacteria bacterium CG_4_9_14_0_2_um_filter_53_11]